MSGASRLNSGFAAAGFVLAGGRSSRMGCDKASLLWEGKSLLARAVTVVQAVTGVIAIVGDPAFHSIDSLPVISDRIRGAGPLGGIEAALAWSSAPWNLIVACDMPSLDPTVLEAILIRAAALPECDAVVPVSAGMPQPLCAAYHRRTLPAFQRALEAGTFKMMEALESVRVGRLEIPCSDSFRNVNTPEDWNTLVSPNSR
jgi:molybdopterin-guanine dinucleotide biosynthesis protein A